MKYSRVKNCRCCNKKAFKSFFDFGKMNLSTEFPVINSIKSKKIPMNVRICNYCKLLQLEHNYDLKQLYNKDYGYKSGVNLTMNQHLEGITKDVEKIVKLKKNDIVLDIASNDGTLLKKYKNKNLVRFGIDPTINKFKSKYPKKYLKHAGFFNKNIFTKKTVGQKAKVITSVAVFYDIPKPNIFTENVSKILDKNGVWVLEQSYFISLFKNNAYDSLCHEHLTYFIFFQLEIILKKYRLKVFNITLNAMNGGSIRFFICHESSNYKINHKNINKIKKIENLYLKKINNNLKNFVKNIKLSRGKLQKFRKARLIRMMQVASNPALLHDQNFKFSIDDEYGFIQKPEPPTSIKIVDKDIYKKIEKYTEQNELPSKMVQVEKLVRKLIHNGEKVIVWTNFIKNIKVLEEQVLQEFNPIVIYGDISKDPNKTVNRDKSIEEFKEDSNPRVLIATPPALSESVSLHLNENKKRVCNHAIYLDRNYNCAQYVQSMDRIHRVGMDLSDDSSFTIEIMDNGEKKEKTFRRNKVYYHLMIANNTIDTSIDDRLNEKFANMNKALDDDWPQCLDYDGKTVKINEDSAKNDLQSLVTNLKNSVKMNNINHDSD